MFCYCIVNAYLCLSLTNHDGEEDFIAILLGFDDKKMFTTKEKIKKHSQEFATVFWDLNFEVRMDSKTISTEILNEEIDEFNIFCVFID
jgi:hypothetical protein